MNESPRDIAGPVLDHGLDLRRRLQAGAIPSLEFEQLSLGELLEAGDDADPVPPPSPGVGGDREDIRYALTCWLDEMFILSSPWASAWVETKLEARLFGSNDRAWAFWERARAAEDRPRTEALEVFYLCAALGFRGELAEDPARFREWLDSARRRLTSEEGWPGPPALEPECRVPPLTGGARFRKMALLAGASALVAIPALAILLVWP
jgi:type IV/VI secretion system ImpK/VasF family protein